MRVCFGNNKNSMTGQPRHTYKTFIATVRRPEIKHPLMILLKFPSTERDGNNTTMLVFQS